jgi:conjugative relaxase-like TrwC/TraI family protein
MLSISSGHSVDYLTREVATGRENYYTGAVTEGEPPGRWYGAGADALGLSGQVDHDDMAALYEDFIDPRDPGFRDLSRRDQAAVLGHAGRKYQTAQEVYQRSLDAEPNADAERREQLKLDASKNERKNVAFLDATFSVQKSVTVLHAAFEAQEVKARKAGGHEAADAWAAHRQAVEDAIWAGNNAALDYLAEHAGYSRAGHHGGAAGRFVDAHDWTVASFLQHTSRSNDPQLHIHNAILNRVLGADRVWRTLDSRAIHKFRAAAAAVGERVLQEHLARTLGLQLAMRPDGKSREILGIRQQVLDLFSSRRRAITRKTAEYVAAFEDKHGRAPTALELDRLQRQATLVTRPGKSHDGETVAQRLNRLDRELRAELDGGLAQVAADVLALSGKPIPVQKWSVRDVLATALADVQSKKAGWTASDLTRAINDALPDHLGLTDPQRVTELLDDLTADGLALATPLDAARPGDDVLPAGLRLVNGASVYDAPGGRLYATPEHVHTERLLVGATAGQSAPALDAAAAREFLDGLAESGIELGEDQAAAVTGALTSGNELESLVGPAGTGKSFVVGVLAHAWQIPDLWGDKQQHKVFGLATSQIATEVLTDEGVQARNTSQWLAAQQRLADGRPFGDDTDWKLNAGDLVVIDESAMTDTAQLANIHRHAQGAGAKLLLIGDHRQLAAVGAAGGMELAATHGTAYELSEARRFTHQWERDASLRLRDGDESVIGEYHKQGRLIDAGAIEQAEASAARGWLADTLAGKRSLLIVDTNEQADRLCAQLRADLVRLGRVEEDGVPLDRQGAIAGVGDLVQARRNGWHLTGYKGNRRGPVNREQYRVLESRDNGGLVVARTTRDADGAELLGARLTLPAGYVRKHVALGYASTVHAAQGLTVDTSHTVVTARTRLAALYVGLSRGWNRNTAHVTTRAVPDEDAPTGTVNQVAHRTPAAVLAGVFETDRPDQSALKTAAESATEARSIRTAADLFADGCEQATAGRTAGWLDQLTAGGHLTAQQRMQLAAEDGATTLNRVLRRAELAGHDPRQVLTAAITSRPLTDARQLINVIHHRITTNVSLDPAGDRYADWTPTVDDPEWRTYLTGLAEKADARRDQLAAQAVDEAPTWAVEAFGPVPDDEPVRDVWRERVGAVAAHRELTGHEDDTVAIGAPPKAGQVEEYASYRAAWHALGRPDAARAEVEMSVGQLLLRVRAYEREQVWAPPYVANELAGTIQAAQQHRATATLRVAAADTATETKHRALLLREADEAAALADELDARTEQLRQVDQARGVWWEHTAATRAAAERAQDELTARRAAEPVADGRTTAEQRTTPTRSDDSRGVDQALDRRRHDDRAESDAGQRESAENRGQDPEHDLLHPQSAVVDAEQGRAVTEEHEFADVAAQQDADTRAATGDRPHPDAAETNVRDLREQAVADKPATREDGVRVPSAEQTSDAIARAQQALAEIQRRDAAELRRQAEEACGAELARWHADDHASARRDRTIDDEPARGWA